jgi:hypothetical protein
MVYCDTLSSGCRNGLCILYNFDLLIIKIINALMQAKSCHIFLDCRILDKFQNSINPVTKSAGMLPHLSATKGHRLGSQFEQEIEFAGKGYGVQMSGYRLCPLLTQ